MTAGRRSRPPFEGDGLTSWLLRRLGRAGKAVRGAAEEGRLAKLLQSELFRGANNDTREVLVQLHRLVSVANMRGVAEVLSVEPVSVALVGPVNVGKSTLLNVLVGDEVAEVSAVPGTTVAPKRVDALGFSLLDTPGADELSGERQREHALEAAGQSGLTLFLLDATRGVTRSEREVFDLVVERVAEAVHDAEGERPGARGLVARKRLVVALNKIDVVPAADREAVVARATRGLGLKEGSVLSLSATKRRGLDDLIRRLVDGAPSMAEALAEVMPSHAEALASQLIFRHAAAAATVALAPLPVPHVLPLTALQLSLVIRLARIYGHELSWKRSREVLPTLAAGIGWRELSRQVVRLVPVTGWALNGGIAYAGTFATGRTAQHLLRTGERPSKEQVEAWHDEGHRRSEAAESADRDHLERRDAD